jgi:hypothetical protein
MRWQGGQIAQFSIARLDNRRSVAPDEKGRAG